MLKLVLTNTGHPVNHRIVASAIEAAMSFRINRLNSCRVVDVGNRGHFRSRYCHTNSQVRILHPLQVFWV